MTILIILVVFILLAFLGYIEVKVSNNLVKVKKYTVKNSKIPSNFNNFKIVHITDVHSKIYGENNSKIKELIDKINPNIIVMSGDIIDQRTGKVRDFIQMYEDIYRKYPTFYSIGNHERKLKYSLYKNYLQQLREIGVHVLLNEKENFNIGEQYIVINALKFRANMQPKVLTGEKFEKQVRFMKDKLEPIDKIKFNILIAHDAENFKMYEKLGVDLIFSGHIHGGIVRFGKIGLLSPRRKLFPKYAYGKNKINNTVMITSSGLGSASVKTRLFNRPEIVEEWIIIRKVNLNRWLFMSLML